MDNKTILHNITRNIDNWLIKEKREGRPMKQNVPQRFGLCYWTFCRRQNDPGYYRISELVHIATVMGVTLADLMEAPKK